MIWRLTRLIKAGAGSVSLNSAGVITQLADPAAAITAQNPWRGRSSMAGRQITLTNADNAVPGNVTVSALNTAGTVPAAGTIDFVDSTGFSVAAQPGNGVGGQEIGVNTTADVTLQTGVSGALAVNGSVNSTSGVVR